MSKLVTIRQGQHTILIGKTGSGKTTLARRLLSSRPYVIVIDSKYELDWPGFTIVYKPQHALELEHSIFRPRNMTAIRRLLAEIYRQGGWNVFIDEVYTLGRGSVQSFPSEYIDLLTRGRSRKITVWTATQRPRFLPLFAFTEATHIFVFQLGSAYDRKHVATMANADALLSDVNNHDFLYYNRDTGKTYKLRLSKSDVI